MKDLHAPDIRNFIRQNETADIAALALKKPPDPNWPYPHILDQIKARQKAKTKIPQWLDNDDIIFPQPDVIEQASSSATANYKASLVTGKSFCDLTGGAGVDSWALLQSGFERGAIIDANPKTAKVLQHNFKALTTKDVHVHPVRAEGFVQTMSPVDIALIDPQRRDKNRKGKYRLDECTPDIAALLPHIKAKTILLKTSPMLDIDQSVQTLKHVQHVHVMQWRGECKEVVYVLTPQAPPNDAPAMTAVTLNDEGTQTHALTFTRLQEGETIAETAAPLRYLYEPGPAFLKAGCYKTLSLHYHAAKLHPHTHLYTSDTKIPDFPGRCFDIKGVYPANAKALPVTKANLAVRNFPQNIDILKKKLKLKDGGDDYLFACTLNNEKHVIIHTHKVNMDNS